MKIEQLAPKIAALGLTFLSLLLNMKQVMAQTDTIRVKDKRLVTTKLKPGLNQYAVYFQNAKDSRSLKFSLWLRDIKLENRGGEKVFAITQHWYGNDTSSYRAIYSVNRASDFAPLYHSETIGKKTKAFNWFADKVLSADTVAGNEVRNFKLDFQFPNFNWNLDIETFEMLPLAEGKSFAIPFFEAGMPTPLYVLYKVTGSEVITTLDGNKVDCWKLYNESDYNGRHFTETYWISKKNHEFLKEEDAFAGGYRYKVRMIGAAANPLPRFVK
ncbi:hypothetical protein LX99_03883 [Mucilaginibacter oryzae]|uniref:Uncharacterized protein n=1 Tax=Mucilaginibacter oryzae TaxID=468058 RepID=A0A316H2V7_9SPHI|nr:hypothetical protein [Mucilaginibacter oryzae]PWK75389.1 hypothetical protein LX99_03883 [Mucilaginibacter oryzae]